MREDIERDEDVLERLNVELRELGIEEREVGKGDHLGRLSQTKIIYRIYSCLMRLLRT